MISKSSLALYAEPTPEEIATAATIAEANKEKTFKQDDVNKILAAEKRKFQKQIDDLTKTVNEAKQKGEASATLEAELENVRSSLRSKEEQAEHERNQLITTGRAKEEALTKERDTWRKNYTDSTLDRSLLDAAIENKAHNPAQIVALLRNNTELVDEIDSEGKKTGRQVPMTTIDLPGEDGKTKSVKLAPTIAVKRLSELQTHANLFTSPAAGGTGGKGNPPGSPADLREIAKDPKKFRELRKAGKLPYQKV